jgi:hypothetical protein
MRGTFGSCINQLIGGSIPARRRSIPPGASLRPCLRLREYCQRHDAPQLCESHSRRVLGQRPFQPDPHLHLSRDPEVQALELDQPAQRRVAGSALVAGAAAFGQLESERRAGQMIVEIDREELVLFTAIRPDRQCRRSAGPRDRPPCEATRNGGGPLLRHPDPATRNGGARLPRHRPTRGSRSPARPTRRRSSSPAQTKPTRQRPAARGFGRLAPSPVIPSPKRRRVTRGFFSYHSNWHKRITLRGRDDDERRRAGWYPGGTLVERPMSSPQSETPALAGAS